MIEMKEIIKVKEVQSKRVTNLRVVTLYTPLSFSLIIESYFPLSAAWTDEYESDCAAALKNAVSRKPSIFYVQC